MSEPTISGDGTRSTPPGADRPPPTVPDFAVPERIGRFEIKALLGEGAYGRVFLGFDAGLDRLVAIKVPKFAAMTDELRDRFLREARATARIHHPNVCPVLEVGTDGELPFFVMLYLAGTTLGAHLEKWKVLPPQNAVALAQRLALGIAAAHEKGVIHRDLKPQNILFDSDKQLALITDFGLARIGSSQATAVGTVFGTPFYMAPEQARGETTEIGPLSDVYSLGVILYRMLAGQVPFTGSVYEVLLHHSETPPAPPSAARRGLDPRLDALVLKALAKRPADRYPSAKAFAEAMAGYLGGGATAWLSADETHGPPVGAPPAPPAPPSRGSSSGERKPAPPPLPPSAQPKPRKPAPAPPPAEEDPGGALRLKVLLAGIGVLFLAIFAIVAVLVATRQHTVPQDPPPLPTTTDAGNAGVPPAPPPKPAEPPSVANGFAGHAFDQAAERRAAAWALSLGGAVQIVPKGTAAPGGITKGIGGTRPVARAEELPAEFTVAFIDLRARPELTDAALAGNLAGLSGPVQVHLSECDQVGDDALKALARIPKLTGLHLTKLPRATDAGLAALAGHPALEQLTLVKIGVTRDGMRHAAKLPALAQLRSDAEGPDAWLADLAPLANLADLALYARDGSEFTERGLPHLGPFKKLSRLAITGRNATDDWLARLAEIDSLVRLDLVNTLVYGPGLAHLKRLPRLKTLVLEDSVTRDEGMAALAECPALEELDLGGTFVGDAGARELGKSATLRKVVVARTNVSSAGVRRLESDLPKCKVFAGVR